MAWTAPRLKWTRRVTPRDKRQHMGRQRSKSGWFAFGWWVGAGAFACFDSIVDRDLGFDAIDQSMVWLGSQPLSIPPIR